MTLQKLLPNIINQYNNSTLVLFIFSGDFPQIGKSELNALLESNNISYTIVKENFRIMILSFNYYRNSFNDIFSRIAYCNYFGILLFYYQIDNENFCTLDNSQDYIKNIKTFSVKKINNVKKINIKFESLIGSLVKKSFPSLNVCLDNPDMYLFICEFDDLLLVFSKYDGYDLPRWQNRRPRARPFFRPFSVYPKLSRALINLCRLNSGQTILDPFCGTGSFGIEASLMNINFIGIDISHKICIGSQKNFTHYELSNCHIINSDSLYLPVNEVDGIVTDFPYGRSSIKKFTDTSKFQSDFFNEISPILKSHSYFVYMLPKNWINFTHSDFELVDQHEIYIHKKLTRLINVVKKR